MIAFCMIAGRTTVEGQDEVCGDGGPITGREVPDEGPLPSSCGGGDVPAGGSEQPPLDQRRGDRSRVPRCFTQRSSSEELALSRWERFRWRRRREAEAAIESWRSGDSCFVEEQGREHGAHIA